MAPIFVKVTATLNPEYVHQVAPPDEQFDFFHNIGRDSGLSVVYVNSQGVWELCGDIQGINKAHNILSMVTHKVNSRTPVVVQGHSTNIQISDQRTNEASINTAEPNTSNSNRNQHKQILKASLESKREQRALKHGNGTNDNIKNHAVPVGMCRQGSPETFHCRPMAANSQMGMMLPSHTEHVTAQHRDGVPVEVEPNKHPGNSNMDVSPRLEDGVDQEMNQSSPNNQQPVSEAANKQQSNKKSKKAPRSVSATCDECGKSFVSVSNFKRHMNIVHDCRRLKCKFCVKTFTSKETVERHIKVYHHNLKCAKCHVVFSNHEALDQHECPGRKPGGFQCNQCHKSYSAPNNLNKHLRVVHHGQVFSCEACDKEYKSNSSLYDHYRYFHKIFKCIKCQEILDDIDKYKEHIDTYHSGDSSTSMEKIVLKPKSPPEMNTCTECGKDFANPNSLSKHIRNMHQDIKFHCSQCPKKYAGKAQLLRHMENVHHRQPHSCSCGKAFKTLQQLSKHQVREHKQLALGTSFQCELCGKGFLYECNLNRHIKRNHEGKTFPCDECIKEYKSKYRLLEHKTVDHRGIYFTCATCQKIFRTKHKLKDHMSSVHNNNLFFQCKKCFKGFADENDMNDHICTPPVAKHIVQDTNDVMKSSPESLASFQSDLNLDLLPTSINPPTLPMSQPHQPGHAVCKMEVADQPNHALSTMDVADLSMDNFSSMLSGSCLSSLYRDPNSYLMPPRPESDESRSGNTSDVPSTSQSGFMTNLEPRMTCLEPELTRLDPSLAPFNSDLTPLQPVQTTGIKVEYTPPRLLSDPSSTTNSQDSMLMPLAPTLITPVTLSQCESSCGDYYTDQSALTAGLSLGTSLDLHQPLLPYLYGDQCL